MGLAICRRIVERHDGQMTAESVPGEGSTFTITLPKQQPPSQPDASEPDASEPDASEPDAQPARNEPSEPASIT
jgi:hypothetical protein